MPLTFIPTPLGNMRDVTLRALDVLREADLIVAEDTRLARKLLTALGITGRELWSYREQNAPAVTPGILERARSQRVAVTTDAGMPGISDPGSELVAAARAAGIAVEVLPGPSAAFAVALLSGFPLRRFCFEGFVPRTTGARRERFAAALRSGATTLWYESPRRILSSLSDLSGVAPEARLFLVRELSKLHEQQLAGTPAEVCAQLQDPVRGEIAFAIAPGPPADNRTAAADAEIDALLARGYGVREVAKTLAGQGRGDRRDLYARAVARRRATEGG
ncbi:MAG: 16S rRNA (cytidine(1402)-2'-O)-methyltransferase, partial [Candidatus Eremiobacteraeota bacterium]|nr:16S rRNA (cytidine(1402)-2'-O)-methyltransferase [Candidatus Eremiobacteraeota bacterium]